MSDPAVRSERDRSRRPDLSNTKPARAGLVRQGRRPPRQRLVLDRTEHAGTIPLVGENTIRAASVTPAACPSYWWLVLGVGLLGLTTSGFGVPLSAAIHTLTAGAIGTMILAVMTRTTLGHTGRTLSADRTTGLIYILVGFAAAVRVVAAFEFDWTMPVLIASAGFWIVGVAIFLLRYGPFLLRPRAAH